MNNPLYSWEDFLASNVEGWERNNLGNLFSHRKDKNHPDLPLLAVTGSGGVVPRDSLERRDTSNVDKSKYLRVCVGDIAYNTMRMWQGVSGLSAHEGIVSPAYTICSPQNGISSEYMSYLFKLPQLVQVFHGRSQGLVDDTLNLKFENFSPIVVQYPPLSEQQKIATILSSVDDVIEKTQAQINKLKDLKTGMMQELLTKGIGHTEFKDSPVGRIPVGWDIFVLDDMKVEGLPILRTGPFGSSLKSKDFQGSGVPVINIQNLGEGYLDCKNLYFVSEEKAQELKGYDVRHGDLVFSRVADVGRSVVIPEDADGWIMSSNLMRISLDKDRISPKYLMYQLVNGPTVTLQLQQMVADGGRQIVTGPLIKQIKFPIPTILEQDAIVAKIDSIDNAIVTTKAKLESLSRLKWALMQDLLTGRVRVKTDTEYLPNVQQA